MMVHYVVQTCLVFLFDTKAKVLFFFIDIFLNFFLLFILSKEMEDISMLNQKVYFKKIYTTTL